MKSINFKLSTYKVQMEINNGNPDPDDPEKDWSDWQEDTVVLAFDDIIFVPVINDMDKDYFEIRINDKRFSPDENSKLGLLYKGVLLTPDHVISFETETDGKKIKIKEDEVNIEIWGHKNDELRDVLYLTIT